MGAPGDEQAASDAPGEGGATVQTLSDEQVEQALRAREEAEQREARELAEALQPGACTVCDQGALVAKPGPPFLGAFIGRPALHCAACKVELPGAPTTVGWLLAMVLAFALGFGGMYSIFTAQRIADRGNQRVVFLAGALLFGGGLFVGYGVHGAASIRPVEERILEHRRRGKRRKRKEPEPEGERGGTWFQENLEAVVVAIILALIIRHFAMEAFVIPTGSMAPTLYGDHFEVTCNTCGNTFALSKHEHEFTSRESLENGVEAGAKCPQCDNEFRRHVTTGDVHGGHKILVNKFVYKLRDPRRYEVIVFKFPNAPWRNYIKRLVGLPGETLEVRNGDLFVDGRLARKPDHVLDAIWIPVHDARNQRERGARRWLPVEAEGQAPEAWELDLDGKRVVCRPGTGEGAPPAWLTYRRPIRDDYGYNRGWGEGSNAVADLRVRADVTAREGAVVRLAVLESAAGESGATDRAVTARFPVGAGEGTFAIEVDGTVQAKHAAPALRPGRRYQLTLSYADDRARLQVDGETLLAWDDAFAPPDTYSSNVRVAAAGAETVFENLCIDRDVFYVRASGYSDNDPSNGKVVVPDDGYFVMGDNSPNSEDGRRWGFVRQGHLIGRAFLVFWPIFPEFELKLIR